MTKESASIIKRQLLDLLSREDAFWSYGKDSIEESTVSDDQLIAWTLRYLDLNEIRQLFQIFSKRKIKEAWRKLLVPEGEYLYTLNRFLAWYCFDAKRPDAYLKSLYTRSLNSFD